MLPVTSNSNERLQIHATYSTWHQICCSNANVRNPPILFSCALVLSCYCACCSVFSLSRPEHTGNDAETPDAHSEAAFQPMFGKGWALMIWLSYPAARNGLTLVFLISVFFFFFMIWDFFIAALIYSIIELFTAGMDSDSNQKGATRNVILGPKRRHCRNIYIC